MLFRRRRTFVVFEEGHSLCSKKDILCVRSKTFLVFEAGHSLCSKQDIPCVRSRTFLVLRRRHFVCSNHQQSTCHFLVNSADRPRILANHNQIRTNPGMIGRMHQKVASAFFMIGTQRLSCFEHEDRSASNTRNVLLPTQGMSCFGHKK